MPLSFQHRTFKRVRRRSCPRGNDAGHDIHPRFNGGDPLRPPTLLVPAKRLLPLCLLLQRVTPTRHNRHLIPLPQFPNLPLPRRRRFGPHLHLNPRRTRLPPQLRAQLLAQLNPTLREARGVPRLRPRTRRRHRETRGHAVGSRQRVGGAAILQRELHVLLHAHVLVEPFAVADVRGAESLLLQHGGDGD